MPRIARASKAFPNVLVRAVLGQFAI
jgi:hypothetical protein